MKVEEVMAKPVATCRPETNAAEATALMWENDCGALPVVGEAGEVTGIVTDRDICIALGTRNARPSELAVRDVIGGHVLVCRKSDDVRRALQTMREGRVRRLPVVNDDAVLEGILSVDDLVLRAESGEVATIPAISSLDAVATLQAIYARENGGAAHGQPAAASRQAAGA